MRLIATFQILYKNKQYEPGAELPTSDASSVEAWLEAGSAVWKDDEDETDGTRRPKARSLTAPAGAEGIATPATGPAGTDLVGKVPDKKARGAIKEPSKKAPKSPA